VNISDHPNVLPPGPPLPGVLQTLAWGLRPVSFFEACRKRYGPTFTFHLYDGRPIVVISKAEDVKALLALGADEFECGSQQAEMLEPFLGTRTVLALDGVEHREERRRLQHAFRTERVDSYRDVVAEATLADMQTWPAGTPFALHERTRAIALEVILRAVFGAGEGPELDGLRRALVPFLANGSLLILIPAVRRDLGSHSPWGRFIRQRAAVHREVLALVERRRSRPELLGARTDMLSALVQGTDDDSLVLDELMTLVLAGHDTTATGLAWAFDLLLHNPTVLERLRAELAAGDESYLDAVVQETLRLRPVVGEVPRAPLAPFAIGDGEVPAGTLVVASVYLAHTDPDRYPDPFAFRPERFLGAALDPATWLPFGGGVRRCLGAAFATLEMAEVLRAVVTHADLQPRSPALERPKRRAVTLMPRHGTRAVLAAHNRPTLTRTSSLSRGAR